MTELTPSYTIAEIAVILNCSARSIYRLIEDGQLQAFRLNRDYRVKPQELERFMAAPVTEGRR